MPPVQPSNSKGRVLVTGAEGFTGRYLLPELRRRGYSVIHQAEVTCNLRDRDAVMALVKDAQPDFVIHLAAISFVAHGSAADMYDVNTIGTTNLLDALQTAGTRPKKLILASSSQVYGDSSLAYLDEDSPCRPISHYACSKLAMEYMAATYFDRLPIVITRPFNYTGAGQPKHFLIPKIVDHFARGEASIELGNLDVVRDFSDVKTVVDVYCRLLDAPVDGKVLNICSGLGRSLQSVIDDISQALGADMRVVVRPELVRASEIRRQVGSNERLLKIIGPLLDIDFASTLTSMTVAAMNEAGQATSQGGESYDGQPTTKPDLSRR